MVPLTDRARTSPDLPRSGRRSACPGLFRFAPALDGEICRVKLPCGRLAAAQAAAVADAADRFGSGVLDATNRSNLQIRGVRADRADALVEALIAAGLGPLSDGGDDIRNVMVSPTAGLDPVQEVDTRPLADRVLATLQTRVAYHALSPKFSILVDGGEQVAAVEHPHDIWLSAMPAAGAHRSFAFGFAGCPPVPDDRSGAVAAVAIDHAHDLVAASLDLFLERAAARPEVTRMRHLLMETTADRLVDDLARRVPFPIVRGQRIAAWRGKARRAEGHIGCHEQREGALRYVGAIPPLGRLTAATLAVHRPDRGGAGRRHAAVHAVAQRAAAEYPRCARGGDGAPARRRRTCLPHRRSAGDDDCLFRLRGLRLRPRRRRSVTAWRSRRACVRAAPCARSI